MDHFDPALISVVMPCHNAAPYVGEAIESVLGQHYPQVELIVVDGGSTDGPTEILRRPAADHLGRIALLFQNRNGRPLPLNRALAHANGNYIAFLDADDTWQPDALSRMHAALEIQPTDITYCGWQAIGNAAINTQPNIHRVRHRRSDPPPSAAISLADQLRADPPPSSTNCAGFPNARPPPWTTSCGCACSPAAPPRARIRYFNH